MKPLIVPSITRAALASISLLFATPLVAQTVWDAGGGAVTNIDTAANWNNDIVNPLNGSQPGAFGNNGSAATMNVNGYFSTLTFNRNDAGGFTIGGTGILSVLASGSGATANLSVSDTAGNGVATVNAPLRVNTDAGGTRLLVIDNRETGTTGESLVISNGISASNGSNAYGLRFGSTGSTRISGALTGTLTSNIQQASITGQNMAGTVTIAGNQTLGAATVGIAGTGSGTVASTAKFVLGDTTADVQSWGSTTVNQAATVEIKSTATTGAIALSNAGSGGSSGGTLDVSGNLSATTLAVGGAAYSGTLKVSGNAAFSGAITSGVTAGSKIVGGAATNGILSLSSGTVGSAVTIGGGGTNENNLALVKASTGTLTINSANTYSGGTTIENGGTSGSFAIALGANNALGSGPLAIGTAATGGNGARLRMNGFNQTVSALSSGATASARVIENFGAANSLLTVNQSSATTYDGALRDRSTGATAATGTLGLTKSGAGTLTLSSVGSTYTGVTTLSGGVLEIAAIGTAGVARTISTTAGSAIVGVNDTTGLSVGSTFSAATLPAGFTITSIDSQTQITINTSSNIATGSGVAAVFGVNSSIGMATDAESNLVFNNGTLRYTGGSATTNRNFSIIGGSAARIDVSNSATNLTVSGAAASSDGSFEKLGTGTLALTGSNAYTGDTTVSAGTLLIGASDRISNSSRAVLAGGTLAIAAGFTETLGALDLNANSVLNLGGTNSQFVFANSLSQDWGSSILSISGTFSDGFSVGFGSQTGLSSIQLSAITVNGASGWDLDSSGFLVTAVPEPGTVMAGLFMTVCLGAQQLYRRIRKNRAHCSNA